MASPSRVYFPQVIRPSIPVDRSLLALLPLPSFPSLSHLPAHLLAAASCCDAPHRLPLFPRRRPRTSRCSRTLFSHTVLFPSRTTHPASLAQLPRAKRHTHTHTHTHTGRLAHSDLSALPRRFLAFILALSRHPFPSPFPATLSLHPLPALSRHGFALSLGLSLAVCRHCFLVFSLASSSHGVLPASSSRGVSPHPLTGPVLPLGHTPSPHPPAGSWHSPGHRLLAPSLVLFAPCTLPCTLPRLRAPSLLLFALTLGRSHPSPSPFALTLCSHT